VECGEAGVESLNNFGNVAGVGNLEDNVEEERGIEEETLVWIERA
jgi:hypothetical protein